MGLIISETRLGKPVKTEEYNIILVEHSIKVQPPGLKGFFFWKRPASVIVKYPDGKDEAIEISDPTRQAQIGILGVTIVVTFTLWLVAAIRVRK